MPDRIDARPILGAIGGVLVLIGLSVTWYQTPAQPPTIASAPLGNAWGVFETLDLVLAVIAAAGLYIAYEQMTGRFRLGEGWLLPLGLLALLIVASQIIDPPPSVANTAGSAADPETASGAWLALGGSGAMLVAGVLSTASVSLALVSDSSSRRGTQRTRKRSLEDRPASS
jgi:hypothetical protein